MITITGTAYTQPKVTSQRLGRWLTIYINDKVHLIIEVNTVLKVQSWIEPSKWWQILRGNTFVIEVTQKGNVQDISEYADFQIWETILDLIHKHVTSQV